MNKYSQFIVLFVFLLIFSVFASAQIKLPAGHPATKDFGLLNMKLKTMEPAMEKGKKLQSFDIKNIGAYLASCKEKAADQNWAEYESRVSKLTSYFNEATSQGKANDNKKNEAKEKFEEQINALKDVFVYGERHSSNPELYSVSGIEYEKSAEIFSFEKIATSWEEYKKADPSKKGEMRLPSMSGGSIDVVKDNMKDFIEKIVLKKADKKIAESFKENKLVALYAAKEALGYARGALKYETEFDKAISMKANAEKRIAAITKDLGEPTGPFHQNHIDEIFLSSKSVNPATANEASFKTDFNYDESIYLSHFLPGELSKITLSSMNKEGYQNLRFLPVFIEIDGKDDGDILVLTDYTENAKSTSYQLLVIPTEADMNTSMWKKFPVQYWKYEEKGRGWTGKSTYTSMFKKFSKLSPGEHNIKFTIGNGLIRLEGMGNKYSKNISFKLKGNPEYYKKMLDKLDNELLDAVTMSETFGSNPTIESKIKSIVNSSKGICLKVKQISKMGVVEYYPEFTTLAGQPKTRIQNYEAAYKDADGTCYVQNYYKEEINMGNGAWQDNGIKQNGGAYKIRCENIDK